MRMWLAILWLFILVVPMKVQAKPLECGALADMPILHEGRVKPFDSLARNTLKTLSGYESMAEMSACNWLTLIIFDPASTIGMPVFEVRNKDLKQYLELNEQQALFSRADLNQPLAQTLPQLPALLEREDSELTQTQRDLLELHNHVALYHDLMRSFSLILPLDMAVPDWVNEKLNPDIPLNYLSLRIFETQGRAQLESIVKSKGEDINAYTADEQLLAGMMFRLEQLRLGGAVSETLRIIPADLTEKDLWVSPWQMIEGGHGSPENGEYLNLWQDMAMAYRTQDNATFQNAVDAALNHIDDRNLATVNTHRFQVEQFYTLIKPYDWALALYLLSALFAVLSFNFKPALLQNLSAASIGSASLIHITAIAARIFILDRPPVGTLYESLIFVSLICALIGLFLWIRRRNIFGLITGAFTAFGLLCYAPLVLQDGESLGVLVAVLNTNFWLATHVLCITIGYGVCIIAGSLAHISLVQKIYDPKDTKLDDLIYIASIFALLFTAVGTILGGIWADQSWGRFWGWDPKENGALLIVLWLIWVQHGRLSGHLNRPAFMAMTACLNIIVALAWFGVNLLGVGLHSYGFISGIGLSLGIFCGLETIIIAVLWALAAKKRKVIPA